MFVIRNEMSALQIAMAATESGSHVADLLNNMEHMLRSDWWVKEFCDGLSSEGKTLVRRFAEAIEAEDAS